METEMIMTVENYFTLLGYNHHSSESYFFVMGKAIKSENAPRYELYYKSTPIRLISDWWGCDKVMDAIVLNTIAYEHDWLGGTWNLWLASGRVKSLLIIPREDYDKLGYGAPNLDYLYIYIMKEIQEKGLVGKYSEPRRRDIEYFYIKENERMLKLVRKALQVEGRVEVHNDYETFYGVGFDRWLRKGLEDLPCKIEVTDWGTEYARTYLITMNK